MPSQNSGRGRRIEIRETSFQPGPDGRAALGSYRRFFAALPVLPGETVGETVEETAAEAIVALAARHLVEAVLPERQQHLRLIAPLAHATGALGARHPACPWRLDIRCLPSETLGLRIWSGMDPLADLPSPEGLWRLCRHALDLAPARRLGDPDRRAPLGETPCLSPHARLGRTYALTAALEAPIPHIADGPAWRTHLPERLAEIGAPLP